jgi:hypothetical protein
MRKNLLVKKGIVLFALVLFFGAICFGSAAIAQVCEGDFNNDGNVLYDDLIIFAADYSRTDCPPSTFAPVAQTGQTVCYNTIGTVIVCAGTGQDGEYRKGVAWPDPRFTDNSDGTVTDNLTGLIWTENANCDGYKNYTDALTYCNTLASGSCGLTDGSFAGNWRLPNIRELHSLIDFGQSSPALPSGHPFINVQPGFYWASTTKGSDTFYGWGVNINDGSVGVGSKVANRYVLIKRLRG